MAEAVRQRRGLGRLGEVAHPEVQPGVWMHEPVSRERCAPFGVVSNARDARGWLGEYLVKQVQVLWMDVVVKPAATVRLQPRPGDDSAVLDPEADLPLVLAALMLARTPGEVADVPRSTRTEQSPQLKGELLHARDDLRCQPPAVEYASAQAPASFTRPSTELDLAEVNG
jgi:hypothetical protein